jgi:hypothetical protein
MSATKFMILPKISQTGLRKKLSRQGGTVAQKLKTKAHLSRASRDKNEVKTQTRSEQDRWTSYEAIKV